MQREVIEKSLNISLILNDAMHCMQFRELRSGLLGPRTWALSKIYASVASDKDSNGLNLVPVTGKSQVNHDLATNKLLVNFFSLL